MMVDETEEMNLLPLCHTTTEGYFVNILQAKHLSSDEICSKWKEVLVYFFYGKPAYLTNDELENYTDDPPITLIFEWAENYDVRRALPFDSGGFERYKLKSGYKKENYAYALPNERVIKGLVKLIYESNENYLSDRISFSNLKKFSDVCREIGELARVYNNARGNSSKFGRQIYSIEVQCRPTIEFRPRYIVLPYTCAMNSDWLEHVAAEFPEVQIVVYGKDEILKGDGKMLEGMEYQMLMVSKVSELIEKYK
jgi:hypothetical protein